MFAVEKLTKEMIFHQKTVEHRITWIDHDFVKPPHYYWINCINCFQNIADAKLKNSNFYITSCGCLYCMDCLDAVHGKCYRHDEVTNAKSLSLNANSGEITLADCTDGEKFNNLFRNNTTMMLETEKSIQFANKIYDDTVERLDQLLRDGEDEKERLLAKLSAYEEDKRLLDLDIANLQRVQMAYTKNEYGTKLSNGQKDKCNSSYSNTHMNNGERYNAVDNRRIKNIMKPNDSNESRDGSTPVYHRVKESNDSKVIQDYWNSVMKKEKPDISINNHVHSTAWKSAGIVPRAPSTDNFRDFKKIRNPSIEHRHTKANIHHELDRQPNGINEQAWNDRMVGSKWLMKPLSRPKDYQELLVEKHGENISRNIANSRCLTTAANNFPNSNSTGINIDNKNGEIAIVTKRVSFKNQVPTKALTLSEYVQSSNSNSNNHNYLTERANKLQNGLKNSNIPNKNYGSFVKRGILKNKMPIKDFSYSANQNQTNSNGNSCSTSNEDKLKSSSELKKGVSVEKVKIDRPKETNRPTINTASCIGSVTDLISRIRSEIHSKRKSSEFASATEPLQKIKYTAETYRAKSPVPIETIWISENVDEVEDLANSFESDIFNLRNLE